MGRGEHAPAARCTTTEHASGRQWRIARIRLVLEPARQTWRRLADQLDTCGNRGGADAHGVIPFACDEDGREWASTRLRCALGQEEAVLMQARNPDALLKGGVLRCVVFAGGVLAGAAAAEWLLRNSMVAVLLIALISWAFAVGVGRPRRWFAKDAVDVVYYSVAMIGVLLLFAHQQPERAKIDALSKLGPARDAVAKAETQLAAFEAAVDREGQIRSRIESNPVEFLDQLKRAEATARVQLSEVEARICAEASGFLLDPMEHDRRPLRDTWDKAVAQSACATAMDQLERFRSALMAHPLDFTMIEAEPRRFADLTDPTLRLGGLAVAPAEAVSVLTRPRDANAAQTERKGLEEVLTGAQETLAQLDTEYSAAADALEKARSTFVGKLALNFWPYVVIILLSLKLGRPPS
jgi:hypothetical protein